MFRERKSKNSSALYCSVCTQKISTTMVTSYKTATKTQLQQRKQRGRQCSKSKWRRNKEGQRESRTQKKEKEEESQVCIDVFRKKISFYSLFSPLVFLVAIFSLHLRLSNKDINMLLHRLLFLCYLERLHTYQSVSGTSECYNSYLMLLLSFAVVVVCSCCLLLLCCCLLLVVLLCC